MLTKRKTGLKPRSLCVEAPRQSASTAPFVNFIFIDGFASLLAFLAKDSEEEEGALIEENDDAVDDEGAGGGGGGCIVGGRGLDWN
jgi:hypothetical protein